MERRSAAIGWLSARCRAWARGRSRRGDRAAPDAWARAAWSALGIGAIIGAGLFSLTGIAAAENAGPGGNPVLCAGGPRLRVRRPVLQRTGGHGPERRVRLRLCLRIHGRTGGVDHRMGPAAGIRGGGRRGRRIVVVLPAIPAAWLRHRPAARLAAAPAEGGVANLPAAAIIMALSLLLIRGIGESALVNSIIVAVKVSIVLAVIGIGAFYMDTANWHPFIPAQHRHLRRVRLYGRAARGGHRVLRLSRVRRGQHHRGRGEEPATRDADRHPGIARHLHRAVYRRSRWC